MLTGGEGVGVGNDLAVIPHVVVGWRVTVSSTGMPTS